MNWVVRTLSTSLGKKQLMAVTGMLFLLFLAVHLIGNLTIYGGVPAFNAYVDKLHGLGALLAVAEVVMLLAVLIHIIFAVILFFENRRARPVKYAVDKSGGGGRTFSSQTMPYTGLLILLFVVIHLATTSRFFTDRTATTTFQILTEIFSHKGYIAFYLVAMVIVALHVRHGLWSVFQTLGSNHPKYMPFIERLSLIFAFIVGIGFGSLPLAISFMK
jgi:succinate dehydrogenase / fumarate reductase cytochrome b subunit